MLRYVILPYVNILLSYRTVPYRTVPYRTVPYRTVPYRTVPYRTVPYRTVPYRTIPYHAVSDYYHSVPDLCPLSPSFSTDPLVLYYCINAFV